MTSSESSQWQLVDDTVDYHKAPRDVVVATLRKIQRAVRRGDAAYWAQLIVGNKGSSAALSQQDAVEELQELDHLVTDKLKGKINYWRHSDDPIITSKDRQHVMAAVRLVNAWCLSVGLELKEKPYKSRLSSMVHKTAKKPILVLGAAVTKSGVVRPQRPAVYPTK